MTNNTTPPVDARGLPSSVDELTEDGVENMFVNAANMGASLGTFLAILAQSSTRFISVNNRIKSTILTVYHALRSVLIFVTSAFNAYQSYGSGVIPIPIASEDVLRKRKILTAKRRMGEAVMQPGSSEETQGNEKSELFESGYSDQSRSTVPSSNSQASIPTSPADMNEAIYGDVADSQAEPGIVGLRNLGNTCFMNSGMQCLMSNPSVIRYFTESYKIDQTNRHTLTGKFAALLHKCWSGCFRVLHPADFLSTLRSHFPVYQDNKQHDCQEFLALLLNRLHEDLCPDYSDATQSTGLNKEKGNKDAQQKRSIISDTFTGLFRNSITCLGCFNVSVSFQPFTYVPLQLPQDTKQHLTVIFIPMSNKIPVRCHVEVSQKDTIKELRQKFLAVMGLDLLDNILFAQVSDNHVDMILVDGSVV